jgi:hypothetical protein
VGKLHKWKNLGPEVQKCRYKVLEGMFDTLLVVSICSRLEWWPYVIADCCFRFRMPFRASTRIGDSDKVIVAFD